MKKVKLLSVVVLTVCLSIFSTSCSDGDTGPQGVQGEQGNQGDQGETGTANVIYSDWIESGIPQEMPIDTGTFTIDALDLDGSIMNEGVVLVYGRLPSAASSIVYPLATILENILQKVTYTYRIDEVGIIRIIARTGSGPEDLFNNVYFSHYRYVLIPGEQQANVGSQKNSSNQKNKQIDYTKLSYEEVIELLNIPE